MSNVLKNLQPERVMKYFEEMCAIPHGSKDTDKIADYCVEFAKRHRLEYLRDKYNNVIIRKPCSEACAVNDTVIIQGHLDMVCAKEKDSDFDFKTDSLRLRTDGEYIWADKTTLGGDDAIAIAMALAILEDETLTHPALECVFTTDEEIGMLGASAMDMSTLKGKYMLNIDSEEEGIFTAGCAGGAVLKMTVRGEKIPTDNRSFYKITVNGLRGGHSGVEIDKGRANANIVLGEVLKTLSEKYEIYPVSVCGGEKDNAIARRSEALVAVGGAYGIENEINILNSDYKEKFADTDENLRIELSQCGKVQYALKCKIIDILSSVPDGVCKMSADIENLVQTSLNLGEVKTEDDIISLTFSLRSSVENEKKELAKLLRSIGERYGAVCEMYGDYPGWEYNPSSKLQSICRGVFENMFGREPQINAIHAGLECGIFCGKIDSLDCISFGPDILDIHTPKERLNINSTKRVYNFLTELLKKLSE
jgi:dipeptidase D